MLYMLDVKCDSGRGAKADPHLPESGYCCRWFHCLTVCCGKGFFLYPTKGKQISFSLYGNKIP